MQATAGYEWNETDLLGVKKCTEIAMSCVETNRNKRPTTEMVINDLNELDAQIEKILRKDPKSLIAQVYSLSYSSPNDFFIRIATRLFFLSLPERRTLQHYHRRPRFAKWYFIPK